MVELDGLVAMARRRFDNLEPERQEQILAAAAAEFAERGYTGASVNRILDAAGLSKGVLYYYFEDKEDLFVTVLERAMSRLFELQGMPPDMEAVERLLGSLEADGYWEALRSMAHGQVRVIRSQAWYARMARAWPRLRDDPGAREALEAVVDHGRRMVRVLVQRGREAGVVRQDLPEGLLVECVLALDEAADRWVLERLEDVDDAELLAMGDARVELIRDLLDARHAGWEQ